MTPGAPLARLALILALGLAGCGGEADSAIDHAPASEKPAYGDTFIEALTGNISGLIPNVLSDSASFEVGSLIYNGLVTRDRDLNLIGELAESWRFSKDCLDLTLHLRRNVRWHDDAPFTAADVVFTYETMINPKTPTAYREDFRAVASVEAVDPYTLHVRYKQPYAKALQSWGVWMLPKHVLEPYVRHKRLTFPIWLDPDMKTAQAWRVAGVPATFLVRPGGEVVGMAMGPREWDSAEMRALIEPLLPGPHAH